ncbi:hypothetical protein RCO48_28520 [Peribacillus frigoritolerans]|nr:hypothetical protein [Peribacillus frigoritolerans]
MFYLKSKTKVDWSGCFRLLLRIARLGETPQAKGRGGSPTAPGKRVPYVPINVQIVQAIKIDKLDFHRVCLQSETHIFCEFLLNFNFTNIQ